MFKTNYYREPTLWLDKVCIDQSAIDDGLRTLPVKIMASRQVLALCGGIRETQCSVVVYEGFSALCVDTRETQCGVVVYEGHSVWRRDKG